MKGGKKFMFCFKTCISSGVFVICALRKQWINKIDIFLTQREKEILTIKPNELTWWKYNTLINAQTNGELN